MTTAQRWADAIDCLQMGVIALAAGLVFGMVYGWFVGVCVGGGFMLVIVVVARAVTRLGRKSLQTRVPQRSVPQKRFPPARR